MPLVDGEVFIQARTRKGFKKRSDLAKYANQINVPVTYDNLTQIENEGAYSEEVLKRACKLLDIDWITLLKGDHSQALIPFNYLELLAFAAEVDYGPLEYLRTKANVSEADYRRWMDGKEHSYFDRNYIFNRKNINDFFGRIQINKFELQILSQVAKSNLQVDIEAFFKSISFKTADHHLHIKNPPLMWPCNCDMHNTKSQCPVHSHEGSEILSTLFSHCLVNLNYDGLDLLWKQNNHLWPPSIDVGVLFAFIDRDLENLQNNGSIKKVLDVGSGTGVLGIYFGKKLRAIEEIHYSDWLLTPLIFSFLNHNLCFGLKNEPIGIYHMANKFDQIDDQYDLTICNPPYLPIIEGTEHLHQIQTVSGVDLLKAYIQKAPKLSDRNYIIFSELAFDIVKEEAKKEKVQLEQLGYWKEVPFRLPSFIKTESYMKHFKENLGLIREDLTKEFPLSHRLGVFKITSK